MNNLKDARTAKLHCEMGTSDKIYDIELKKDLNTGLWSVYFEYGARTGKNPTTGLKVKDVAYAEALKVYNKLVSSKVNPRKGYQDKTTKFHIADFHTEILKETLEFVKRNKLISPGEKQKLIALLESSDSESRNLAANIIDTKVSKVLSYVA